MSDTLEIQILNWEDYCDSRAFKHKHISWIRLPLKLTSDPIWDASPAILKVFLDLLTLAANQNHKTGIIRIHKRALKRLYCPRKVGIRNALDTLNKMGFVEIRELTVPSRNACVALREDKKEKRGEDLIALQDPVVQTAKYPAKAPTPSVSKIPPDSRKFLNQCKGIPCD